MVEGALQRQGVGYDVEADGEWCEVVVDERERHRVRNIVVGMVRWRRSCEKALGGAA